MRRSLLIVVLLASCASPPLPVVKRANTMGPWQTRATVFDCEIERDDLVRLEDITTRCLRTSRHRGPPFAFVLDTNEGVTTAQADPALEPGAALCADDAARSLKSNARCTIVMVAQEDPPRALLRAQQLQTNNQFEAMRPRLLDCSKDDYRLLLVVGKAGRVLFAKSDDLDDTERNRCIAQTIKPLRFEPVGYLRPIVVPMEHSGTRDE